MNSVEHNIIEKLEKDLKIDFYSLFTYIYIIFLFFLAIDKLNQLVFLEHLYHAVNTGLYHFFGIAVTLITLKKNFLTKKARKFAWYKFKLLFSENKESSIIDETELFNYLTEEEVQKNLIDFSIDAREIMIFAGDADFLMNKTGGNSLQFDEIKKFGSNCKLLLNDNINVDISLLKSLHDSGVKIKLYPLSKPNIGLRGRIKVTDDGRSAKLFDKVKDNYLSQELKNNYIVQMLCQEYDDVFQNGRNPFIKYILFDLAGVYCDGDFEGFLDQVKNICGIEIENKNSNYLCVDDRLNLGDNNFTIVDYIQEKGDKELSLEEKKKIREIWNTTWTINSKMKDLANKLRDNGYTIAICSNCDEDNGEKYLIRNYFDGFERFFSYEVKKLKPNKDYFDIILKRFACHPYECLFIDDHEKNIESAKEFGFNTIKVTRTHTEDEKVAKLSKAFNEYSINYSK